MDFEEAKILWPKIQDFIKTYNREPNINSNDALEMRMGVCYLFKGRKEKISKWIR